MLRNARKIKSFLLQARDGEVGILRDYYFDLQDWSIRYFVVEAGRWFSSQRVLISPEAVQEARWDQGELSFNVTKAQLEQCPTYNPLRQLTREYEIRLRSYFGWSTYWNGQSIPPIAPEVFSIHPESETVSPLQSANSLNGSSVVASDGEVGKVVNFLVDEVSWKIRCLVVQTNWLLGHHVLISPQWINGVDIAKHQIAVGQSCAVIQKIPPYNPLQTVVSDTIAV